jgi:hypothetical protein
MITAAQAKLDYAAALTRVGEDVVVRRFTGSGTPRPHTDTTTRARIVDFLPSELVGPVVQGDRKVIALAEPLAGILPLTTNDKLVVRGKELAIKAVDDNTRRIEGVAGRAGNKGRRMTVTADQALAAVRSRLESGSLSITMYWHGDDAPVLPDTPAAFAYLVFNNEGSILAGFGGGRGNNLYRNRARVEAYTFAPKTGAATVWRQSW